jgi:hypothetical protein
LLDVLRKRIDHRAFVVTFVRLEQPAANERVDLATVKFNRKTPKASAPSCPATPHSLCCTCPSAFGLRVDDVDSLIGHNG